MTTLGYFPAKETQVAKNLGPWTGRYTPNHKIVVYKEGDPNRPLMQSELDLGSVIAINTKKNLNEVAGTFSITLKDGRAMYAVGPMDVVVIWLQGHNQSLACVWRGLVSSVVPAGSVDTEGGEESVTISGACMGKYLQVNMFFRPVWRVKSQLPTILVYGIGGVYNHTLTPREIFRSVYRNYVVGVGNEVGLSGTPAAKHWLDATSRFEKIKSSDGSLFKVPYVQFSEEPTEAALTRLEITGFSEAWVDEVGRVVYRRPAWDQPVAWVLPAGEATGDWELPVSDSGLSTYIEVVPTGNPGLSTANAEALLAGRAPVPSSYVTSLKPSAKQGSEAQDFAEEFIIDTNATGQVTPKGERNYYYRMMRKWGMRPMQITSALLVSARQAQDQAQGLLRFFGRKMKTGRLTIPGEPNVRLGQNILVRGSLRGQRIERAFYIEGVEHDYVEEDEGGHYLTTLELGHGRDPHDAHFPRLMLEDPSGQFVADLRKGNSEMNNEGEPYSPGTTKATALSGGKAMIPGEASEAAQKMISAGNQIVGKEYSEAKHGLPLNKVQSGYDCSSASDFILYNGGFLPGHGEGENPVSGTLATMYQEGAGKEVTVYANSVHAFIVVAGVMFNTWDPVTGEDKLAWYPALASSISAIESTVGTMAKRHPRGY